MERDAGWTGMGIVLIKVLGIFRGYTGTGEMQNAIPISGYFQIKWFWETGQYYFLKFFKEFWRSIPIF